MKKKGPFSNSTRLAEFIKKLIHLVELERKAQIEATLLEIKRLKGSEREKKGRAILGLNGKIIGSEFGYKLVKYGRKKVFKTEINVGDLVLISKRNPLKSDLVGPVVEKGNRFIVVALKSIPSWALKNVRLDLYANDLTYKRQIENLKELTPYAEKALKLLLGLSSPRETLFQDFSPFDQNLNESQREAISKALGSQDFFLIHGPFGTGKTRTVVELILQEVKRGSKVLATAESNIAVDNMLERLVGKVKLVRLGHPSRVTKELKSSTLSALVEDHPKYEEVKRLQDEAEALIKLRDQFKKPTPQRKRGLKEEEILFLASRGKGLRGISAKTMQELAQWIKLNQRISEIYEKIRALEEEIIRDIVKNSEVILATNSSSALEFIKDIPFDVAVIDEASQATIPSVLIPISKAKRFILAGDHKQLPPTILNEKAEELSKTLFEGLISLYPHKSALLRVQYRMNELLMEFPNKEFYDGKIVTHEEIKNITLRDLRIKKVTFGEPWDRILSPDFPLVFVDTSKCQNKWERQRKDSTSRENPLEAQIVKNLVERFLKIGIKKEWIGVITPYDDQVDLISSYIGDEEVEVKSVDGYQGREKEVIILSFVRSNREKDLGFLEDLRRLNVSLTRAKRKLIAIGDSETLSAHPTYKRFIEFVKEKGIYLEFDSFYFLSQDFD